MGARLVGAALNPHWTQLLTAEEHRVFLAMCHTASDIPTLRNGQTAGLYWAGHDALMIVALGDLPGRDTVAYRTAARRIRRYIARLVAVGAVELIAGGQGRGRRAYYRVRPGLMAVDNRPPAEIAELLKEDISGPLLDAEKVTSQAPF